MRKPTLLVLSLALLAVVLILVVSTWSRRSQSHVSIGEPAPAQNPAAALAGSSATPIHTEVAIEGAASTSRAEAAVKIELELAPPTKFRNLRVHVLRSAELAADHESAVEVRAANLTGALYDALQDGPNTYVFKELSPGQYIVHAKTLRSRAATTSAVVAADKPESEATVMLERTRSVRIRWGNQYGEPVTSCVTRGTPMSGVVEFEIRASWTKPDLRQTSSNSFESLRLECTPRITGGSLVQIQRLNSWGRLLETSFPPTTMIEIGTIEIEPGQPAWLSVWSDGRWLASQEVGAEADEIEFVTPCEALPFNLPLLDGIDIEGLSWADREAEEKQALLSGERRALEVIVVDEHGRRLPAVDFELTLLEEETSNSSASVPRTQRKSTNGADVNLVFPVVPDARYELRCSSRHYSCESRLVASPASKGAPPIQIVVHPAVTVGIGIDPVPKPSARLRMLGPDGGVFRECDVNEFGVATLYLATGSYRLELVESGRVTLSSSVLVNSNPTTLVLRR